MREWLWYFHPEGVYEICFWINKQFLESVGGHKGTDLWKLLGGPEKKERKGMNWIFRGAIVVKFSNMCKRIKKSQRSKMGWLTLHAYFAWSVHIADVCTRHHVQSMENTCTNTVCIHIWFPHSAKCISLHFLRFPSISVHKKQTFLHYFFRVKYAKDLRWICIISFDIELLWYWIT